MRAVMLRSQLKNKKHIVFYSGVILHHYHYLLPWFGVLRPPKYLSRIH
jgi:hypothetical protein